MRGFVPMSIVATNSPRISALKSPFLSSLHNKVISVRWDRQLNTNSVVPHANSKGKKNGAKQMSGLKKPAGKPLVAKQMRATGAECGS